MIMKTPPARRRPRVPLNRRRNSGKAYGQPWKARSVAMSLLMIARRLEKATGGDWGLRCCVVDVCELHDFGYYVKGGK